MKLYLVCVSGYDSCYHLGIYDSHESAKKVCVDWIDSRLFDLEVLVSYREKVCVEPIEDKEEVDALLECKQLGEFNMGGGVYDFPIIEEFELNEIQRL